MERKETVALKAKDVESPLPLQWEGVANLRMNIKH
jgi:hypothetical protein